MPIYEQTNTEQQVISSNDIAYHDDQNRLAKKAVCVHFGYGDVGICNGKSRNKEYADELCFTQATEAREIGENESDEHFNPSPIFPPVRFVFDRPESIDVVIHQLQALKAEFPAEAVE